MRPNTMTAPDRVCYTGTAVTNEFEAAYHQRLQAATEAA
jgi:hypothetical protein